MLSKAPEVKTQSGAMCSSNLLFWALHLTCGQSLLGVTCLVGEVLGETGAWLDGFWVDHVLGSMGA